MTSACGSAAGILPDSASAHGSGETLLQPIWHSLILRDYSISTNALLPGILDPAPPVRSFYAFFLIAFSIGVRKGPTSPNAYLLNE
jgi:hypothetical protein